jgi:hypothetical protein
VRRSALTFQRDPAHIPGRANKVRKEIPMALSIDRLDFYVITETGGRIVGLYQPSQRKRANTRADKLNLEYGAHRYSVTKIRFLQGERRLKALQIEDWKRYDWAI